MTPDEYRHHSCARKVPFVSRGEARQMVRVTSDRYGGGRLRPYACEFADHWHIGHDRSKKERRSLRG